VAKCQRKQVKQDLDLRRWRTVISEYIALPVIEYIVDGVAQYAERPMHSIADARKRRFLERHLTVHARGSTS
jgi:hypothetical protein